MKYLAFSDRTTKCSTFGQGFDGDNVAGVPPTCSRYGDDPDAVLTVAAEVGDAVEIHVWGGLKLAHYLRNGRNGSKNHFCCRNFLGRGGA